MGVYKDLNDYEIMYLVSENDEDAKEVLFKKYYPIIVKMAMKYNKDAKNCGLELDDLIQEGYFGLCSAINCYNPNKDTIFYTYAILSIKSKMLNALRIANNKKSSCLNNSISLFRPISSGKEDLLFDFISDSNALYPEDIVVDNEMMFLLKDFLFSLDLDNAVIFELKLNGFSYKDISVLTDVSFKNVSNTVSRNNKKFRNFLESKKIFNCN